MGYGLPSWTKLCGSMDQSQGNGQWSNRTIYLEWLSNVPVIG